MLIADLKLCGNRVWGRFQHGLDGGKAIQMRYRIIGVDDDEPSHNDRYAVRIQRHDPSFLIAERNRNMKSIVFKIK